MLKSRPDDALVKLVKTVETVEIVETVETVETVQTEDLKKVSLTDSVTDNLKARDASASKNSHQVEGSNRTG